MEDLNKNQIVLLTLLVSFVTSIATGIMTNALLLQAPVEVVRNINSIVEKTIEKVTPANPLTPVREKEVTTIVVKEEDSIVDTISKNINSVVRITEEDTITKISSFYGIGLIINKDGLIATDRKIIPKDSKYTATANDGTKILLTALDPDKKTNFILFKPIIPKDDGGKNAYVFVPAVISDVEPKLGQTLIGLGGEESNAVSVGRVVLIYTKDSTVGTTTTKYISGIETDMLTKDIVIGSPMFNLSGNVIGIKLSFDSSKLFTPVSVLKNELNTLIPPPEAPKTQ